MHSRRYAFSRRAALATLGAGFGAAAYAPWLPALADRAAADPRRRRHCILLWMNGGPSQTDTFDMKPDHGNGGEFKEIATSVPGLRFSEHLPLLAKHAERLAVVRSLSTREGDHARAAHLARTGHVPAGDIAYPSIACSLAHQLATDDSALPNYVSVAPQTQISPAAFGPGFLGPRHAPAVVAAGQGNGDVGEVADLRLANIRWPDGVTTAQAARRREIWQALQKGFLSDRPAGAFHDHHDLMETAAAMMRPEVRAAFDLTEESAATREQYGGGTFGQGCLLARRLVERGVPFVEVALADGLAWDTHQDNFNLVRGLSEQLDAGWATLMSELEERGLLDSTTILWIGEFGRTPVINPMAGRDHFPAAWSCVFGGGGIAGGGAYGATSDDGMTITDNKVGIGDILATLCQALGVPPEDEQFTPADRPVKLAEGTPIDALLA